MNTILIIEDDQDIHEMLKVLLHTAHYQTLSAYSGTEGIYVHNEKVDLVLLDLMLPGKSGEEVILELKEKCPIPVIVMSALHDVEKKLDLFQLGADDYITKPFSNEELLARIKVQLRHASQSSTSPILKYKDIELNSITYQVTCNGINLNLTKHEFELLKVLMEHQGQVCTKSTLFDQVWGDEDSADDNTLNVHISKLRKHLKDCNPNTNYIETIWSIGYRLPK